MKAPSPRWDPLVAVGAAALVHAGSANNAFYTHDCWNAVQLGERIGAGGLPLWENIQRILVTLTFVPRAAAGLTPWVWHLPNLLLHAACAALVSMLARQLSIGRAAAVAAGVAFAVAPLLVHPVEWVGGGYDLMATFGILGVAVATLDGRRWLAGTATLVALLGKEVGVVIVPVLAVLWITRQGWPRERSDRKRLLLDLALPTALTLGVVALRVIQVGYAPNDNLAGRTVVLDVAQMALSAPAVVGTALLAPLTELLGMDEPSRASGLAAIALGLCAALGLWRAPRLTVGLGLAAGIALGPVLLLGMERDELLANTRYLYTAAALLAPLVPALIATLPSTRAGNTALAVLVSAGVWGGVDRVDEAARTTQGVAPLIDAVLLQPRGTSCVVLTTVFDEPTARFLMSQYLKSRGITTSYVMRGTGVSFGRRGQSSSDSALAYFGPRPERFDPGRLPVGAQVLLHVVGPAEVAAVTDLPAPLGPGEAHEVPVAFQPVRRGDDDEAPPTEAGRTWVVERQLGPAGASDFSPWAVLPLPGDGPVRAVELTIRARTAGARPYARSYHDRFLAVYFGPPFDERHAFSAEVRADGNSEVLYFDLAGDPILTNTAPKELALFPLSQPGTVSVERVRVWR